MAWSYMNQIYARSGKKWIEMTYDREGAVLGLWLWLAGHRQQSPLHRLATGAPHQREGPVTAFVDLDEGMRD